VITTGYDIGGAHLKVALVDNGVLIAVEQVACPLWRGVDELTKALDTAFAITRGADRHAITMTGELADVFPDRYTGVARITEICTAKLGAGTQFWIGPRGFGNADDALLNHGDVASTNFLATAAVCARRLRDGLLIDMGSTTTDIIPLADGQPTPRGLNDADRLRTGELVYTGLTRTPVMAVASQALFQGTWQTLARDPFATMADVRRITCDLPEGVDLHATQDGRGTSEDESRARLARCFGRDVAPGEEPDWAASARFIAELQLRSIHDGCLQVLSAQPPRGPMSVVAAGIGERIALEVARRLDLPAISFGAMIKAPKPLTLAATRYAPAVAVALLVAEHA
jgi:(4-(4-[2-(gamma-L-glutamylamino)ethyl]phenoxymethyl)furan-2-yl)methanamine synthase